MIFDIALVSKSGIVEDKTIIEAETVSEARQKAMLWGSRRVSELLYTRYQGQINISMRLQPIPVVYES